MADLPFISDDPRDWQQTGQEPELNPLASMLMWARGKIPENPNGVSLSGMARDGLKHMSQWAQGVTDPSAITPEAQAAPIGAAALSTPFAAAAKGMDPSTLYGFIGPAQAARLDLTPGSRGSLEALEKAKAIWEKGGVDPGAIAETWAKHGWAPPEAFGVGQQPFSWLEMPDLRLKDEIRDYHLENPKAQITTEQALPQAFAPSRDLDRLLQAEPGLADTNIKIITSPSTSINGRAGYSDATAARLAKDHSQQMPPYDSYMGQSQFFDDAESIMRGHELRGHGLPRAGGAEGDTVAGVLRRKNGLGTASGTSAHAKVRAELDRLSAESNAETRKWVEDMAAGHQYRPPPVDRVRSDRINRLRKDIPDKIGQAAPYFAQPVERMARHAHLLDQAERAGLNPFDMHRAPGVMSTYLPNAMGSERIFNNSHLIDDMPGLFTMRDLILKP